MSRARWTRRQFIKTSLTGAAALAAAPLAGACSHIDRIIEGDSTDQKKRVIILGAGLSGLVAARELKKNGISFRLFEGSSRLGGRTLTIEDFNQASHYGELGGEWISQSHDFIIGLCRDLHVDLHEIPNTARSLSFFAEGQLVDMAEQGAFFSRLDKGLLGLRDKLNDNQWDALSMEETLGEMKNTDRRSLLWLRRLIQLEWGCDANDLSALAFFERFRDDPSGLLSLRARRFKVRGGSQLLAKALYDRISGVIPDKFILFQHRLIEIDRAGSDLALTFETPRGEITITARVVICTLPFSALRDVEGLENIGLHPLKFKAIHELGYGTHGKLSASFADRFWLKREQFFSGEIESQWLWESSTTPATRGVLTASLAGKSGREIGLHSVESLKSDLKKMGLAVIPEENSQVMNWHQSQWSRGSVSLFRPGQTQAFSSALSATERNGTLIFAGEHTSLSSMGTMNGAVESGLRAAMEAARFKNELS
jgi:monoamine oxidase